jgi:hypothetical protein
MTDPTFTIDGRPVPLGQWQLEAVADWGDKTLTGQLPATVTSASQGAPIQAWRSDSSLLWSGDLTLDPRKEGDVLHVRAEGYAEKLAAQRARMFYRTDGMGEFVSSDSDPHVMQQANSLIDGDVRAGKIIWATTTDKAYAVADSTYFLIWKEGSPITRVSYKFGKTSSQANMDLRTNKATGPSGTVTFANDYATSSANGSTNAFNITSPEDMILIALRANAVFTPTVRQKFWVTEMKVYGRTTDDAFSVSDVVADVGVNAGFDTTKVQANSLGVLPLDWTDSHPALLDFMSELTGWRWLVRGDELRFGPFERTWKVDTTTDAVASLEPERRSNRAVVPFRYLSGARGQAEASPEVDPLPGQEVVYWGPELPDPQQNATLASSAAGLLAEYMASRRVSGPVQIGRVRSAAGTASPYDVEAGDLLEMTDLLPYLPAQRIRSVSYRPGEDVQVGIGETFNPLRIIAAARGREKRGRGKKRRFVETSV